MKNTSLFPVEQPKHLQIFHTNHSLYVLSISIHCYQLQSGDSKIFERESLPHANLYPRLLLILLPAIIADYKIIMDILNIIIGAWAAHHVT